MKAYTNKNLVKEGMRLWILTRYKWITAGLMVQLMFSVMLFVLRLTGDMSFDQETDVFRTLELE
ncbi:hypothetical protein QQ008_18615 [Fulvivirgaceae bacterium BMA10]|uniref:Uncharacterized protein n=1 Tax=Splendidivirga corallicola TaxID=3051826 RepID=A0ABT8KRL6_9BACT|nr:hypothetical protein [Fulvivirgaceae bacterium BMA10]